MLCKLLCSHSWTTCHCDVKCTYSLLHMAIMFSAVNSFWQGLKPVQARAGQCCSAPGELTEGRLCCPHALDRCGACGDGSSCNTEGTFTLSSVPDGNVADAPDVVLELVCLQFGYAIVADCPMAATVGSAVAPASRLRRLRAIALHGLDSANSRDTADYGHVQALDVAVRAFVGRAAKRGARVAPLSRVFGHDGMWSDSVSLQDDGRSLLQGGTSGALEIAVRPCVVDLDCLLASCLSRC